MRALICNTPFRLEAIVRDDPVPGENEVMVRIQRVGLCGTDYHIYGGTQPYLAYPRVMGHELGGEVVSAPAGSGLSPGQIVAINPYRSCGECLACRNGKQNCCARIRVLGVHTDGGMCDFIAVPQAQVIDATGLTLNQAAMVEFLAIGAHAVSRAQLSKGARVLVVGAGPIGIAVGLMARQEGAPVTLLDTRLSRLSYAQERLGFSDIVEATADTRVELSGRTGGEMFDFVFDATGNISAMRAGLDYVGHGGTYVLVGVAKDDLIFPDPEFHMRETSLLASRNALPADFARVIAAIKDGTIPTDTLLTHIFDADELPERLPALIADADNVLKAIVRF